MAESTGKTGRGVRFKISDGNSPAVFVAVANCTSINLSGRDAEEIDFTTLDSTGGFREYRQGFKDGGTVALEIHFNPEEESHTDLLALWLAGTVVDFQIDYTDAWPFVEQGRGYVQNPGDITVDVSNPIGGQATFRITGGTQIIGA
jgi:predicted secreted protein